MFNVVGVLANKISKIRTEKFGGSKRNLSRRITHNGSTKIELSSIIDIQNDKILESIFQNEFSILSEESYQVFAFLKDLRLQIIDNQIDLDSVEEIKNKVLRNKNKYSNPEIAELAEDILLRLEIEIAKLEMLKDNNDDDEYHEEENIEQNNIEKQNKEQENKS